MNVEHFTFNHTGAAALRFFDPSNDKVLDFNDETWKLIASATTPYISMTAPGAANLGTGRQLNRLAFNLARLHRGPLPKKFWVGKYDGATPAATVNPTEGEEITVQLGQFGDAPLSVETRMSCRTLDGYAIQLTAGLKRNGRPANLMACGRAMFTANAGTDVITSAGHGLSDGDFVCFHTIVGTLPGGISANTAYEVSDATTDTFKLVGVDISSTGTAPNYWDAPSVTFTVREHGSDVASFTKTLTAAAIRGNQFEGETPEGTAFTVDAGTDTIESTAHGLSNGNQIAVATGAGGTLPDGLAEDATYHVVNAGTDDFQVALTPGGDPVEINDAGTGVHKWVPATAMLTPDRQHQVKVSMTLAGETIEDDWRELVIG